MSQERRSLHLLGATGDARTEVVNGKEYLVVPVVALMEGVIHAVNAETPEFVPYETLEKAAESWNGKPVTLGHPKKGGTQCSAAEPGVVESHGLGFLRNSRAVPEGRKLLMEALVEKARAKRMSPDMYVELEAGRPIEVSVGASVVTDKKPGIWNRVKKFAASWVYGEGDHLALLPGGRGACSVEMGCGTHRAAMRVCADRLELHVEKTIIDPETLRCLRDVPQGERDKMPASDFAGPDQSFPIKTQADVDAAAHLVGKAADPEAVKKKIIAIAKRKGLTVPDAWKGGMKAAQAGDDVEEQAELIAYQAMRTMLDGVAGQWEQLGKLVDDLIADETESPTETPEEEDAEETLESARLDGIRSMCASIMGALSGVSGMTYGSALSDGPRYGELKAAAGARHSAADMKHIQAMHDHSMELGAQCDRGNLKTAEEKKQQRAKTLDDPTARYIAMVGGQRVG